MLLYKAVKISGLKCTVLTATMNKLRVVDLSFFVYGDCTFILLEGENVSYQYSHLKNEPKKELFYFLKLKHMAH